MMGFGFLFMLLVIGLLIVGIIALVVWLVNTIKLGNPFSVNQSVGKRGQAKVKGRSALVHLAAPACKLTGHIVRSVGQRWNHNNAQQSRTGIACDCVRFCDGDRALVVYAVWREGVWGET